MPGVVNIALPRPFAQGEDVQRRVTRIVAEHHDAVWRSLRRFGLDEAQADDAAQEIFCVLARRLDDVEDGKEKSFLFGVLLRVVRTVRRSHVRRHEVADDDAIQAALAIHASPEELLDERRAREVLDALLAAMPFELREVLVLHQIEEMTMAEIAAAMGLPPGTVASRLRRAREVFSELAKEVTR